MTTLKQSKLNKYKQLNTAAVREVIGFKPHRMQKNVLMNQTRFTTLCWGRRSGKTMLAAYIALKFILSSSHNVWVVAPTYDLARKTWNYLMQWIPKLNKEVGQFLRVDKSRMVIETIAGSVLELKSADNPTTLLGEGLDLLIVDEAARIPEEVWTTNLRPTLSDRQGKALFISTPYGKNWFYDMMLKGIDEDPKFKQYSYFHMATDENEALPHIKEEVAVAENDLSHNEFLQEYKAEFIEGAGTVFRNVKDCLYPTSFTNFPFMSDQYNPDHVYQGGLDLARLVDFSVVTLVDRAHESGKFKITYIDRFNELDWKMQCPRFQLASQKYQNPRINTEKNNIGDVIIENLGGNFESFTTTNESKKALINNLAILIEQKKILIPNIPVLVAELEAFSYEVTPSGNITYAAPHGYHDDMVMSLALAVKDLKNVAYQAPQNEGRPRVFIPEQAIYTEESYS